MLDRLGRCLKLIVSSESISCHEFASQFGLEFVLYAKKNPNLSLIQSRPHVVYFNGSPTGHCLASVESSAPNHGVMAGRTDTRDSEQRRGGWVCAFASVSVCARACVHACVLGVFAIYDNYILHRLMYADDLVLLSPSAKGLQRLVDICAAYGDIHDIKFNHAKTVCMYLPSKGNCTLNLPLISLNLQKLSFVPKFKYLGSFITQDNSDDENMRRQRGNCYARSNGIIKNFYACSPVVKCDLFKAFCCNMYCSHRL